MCNRVFVLGARVEHNHVVFIGTLLIRAQQAQCEGVKFILRFMVASSLWGMSRRTRKERSSGMSKKMIKRITAWERRWRRGMQFSPALYKWKTRQVLQILH